MYYDRSLPDEGLLLFAADGAFEWLVPWVKSTAGASPLADLQFRCSRGDDSHGSIQIYFGGTSALKILRRAGSQIELGAHPSYRVVDAGLFGKPCHVDLLGALRGRVIAYLDSVVTKIGNRHLDLEAKLHGGMMRRHALDALANDPWFLLDREVVVGHDNAANRDALDDLIRETLAIDSDNHRELDAVGLRADGVLLFVELKARATTDELETAALQAASHVLRFQHLEMKDPAWRAGLTRLVQQKAGLGLLPLSATQIMISDVTIPVIAAPDSRADWAMHWRESLRAVRRRAGLLLHGLQLWRVNQLGVVEEQVVA